MEKISTRKEVYMCTKRDNRPEAASSSTHFAVPRGKKQTNKNKTCVSNLITSKSRSLAGGRTFPFSLCMV